MLSTCNCLRTLCKWYPLQKVVFKCCFISLQSIFRPSLAEYQRLRCRVAFHALQFRTEILSLGRLMVERVLQPVFIAWYMRPASPTLVLPLCSSTNGEIQSPYS
nr:uncharacterized protein At1g04910 [Ipomoea trifida]